MLLDQLHPAWTYRFSAEYHSGEFKRPLDQEFFRYLAAFPVVPPDYLALYVEYGGVEFLSPDTGHNFDLRSPLDAYDYHFDQGRAEYLPGMYPMTASPSSRTLDYGTVEQRTGVYLFWDNAIELTDGMYIAPSLFDLLFRGVGVDLLLSS